MSIITFQPEFRPALPCVIASKDYREFRATLVEMDRILVATGLEDRIVSAQIASYEKPVKPRQLQRHCKTLRLALRHGILLAITGLSYRELARRMADSQIVKPSVKRIAGKYGTPGSYTGDRGFDAKANDIVLEDLEIINAICPRSVPKLQEKLEDEGFCLLQKRRGGTEGRIGIFKNAYLGSPLRSKGFANRRIRVEWCILGHNLWKLATMAAQKRAEIEAELAAAA